MPLPKRKHPNPREPSLAPAFPSSSSESRPSASPSRHQPADPTAHAHIPNHSSSSPPDRHNAPMLTPQSIGPLLLCLLCRGPLLQPTTLQCGHSVCAHHVTSSSLCPLPNCSFKPGSSATLPRIPSNSRVRYRPAPASAPLPLSVHPTFTPNRSDVTLCKTLTLTARTKRLLDQWESSSFPRHSVYDDDDNGDDNDPDSAASSSSSSFTSAHDDPDQRPLKRRRRHLTSATEPHHQQQQQHRHHHRHHHHSHPEPDDDLLTHLRVQAVRERTLRHDDPVLSLSYDQPIPPPRSPEAILSRFEKDLLAELTCEICFVLFYQPITTPCQHTFCAKCLQRSLDHSSVCPICRQELPGFAYFQDHPTNRTLLSIILMAFPMLYKERGEAIAAEERDSRLDTPIFVCQLSFPGMPTLLHFFEPRYRLMLRRCLESPSPRFGMIMPPKPGAGSSQVEYGTMLEIRSVQMLPDGRSMVETWGSFRFRILERGILDGYMVGRVERIDDYAEDFSTSALQFPLTPPSIASSYSHSGSSSAGSSSSPSPLSHSPSGRSSSSTLSTSSTPPTRSSTTPPFIPLHPASPTNEELMAICRSFLDRLQRGTAPWVVQRLSSTYGSIPTDPTLFSFWVALVLPIDEHEKAKLLPLRSARLRLLLLVHWIEQLNNQWWFSSGCTIF